MLTIDYLYFLLCRTFFVSYGVVTDLTITQKRSAIRPVSLSKLMKPISNGTNCEEDNDNLLVDVLDSAAAAAQSAKISAAAIGAVTIKIWGTTDFDEEILWASEDEDEV